MTPFLAVAVALVVAVGVATLAFALGGSPGIVLVRLPRDKARAAMRRA